MARFGKIIIAASAWLVIGLTGALANDDLSWIDKRVQACQPTTAERRFDEIGWAKNVREAERLAKEHSRPVFLFTHHGEMSIGRCWGGAHAMRAGPLSNPKVIEFLNMYFISVYASRDDGPYYSFVFVPQDDKTEVDRIYRESLEAKLPTGEVHVFILNTEGHPIAGVDIGTAGHADKLIERLQSVVDKLHLAPLSQPIVKPSPQSVPPPAPADAVMLHLTARALDGRSTWGAFPAESWIPLTKPQWTKLLPPGRAAIDTTWEIDPTVTAEIFRGLHPPTENNNLKLNVVEQSALNATILSVRNGVARARLAGTCKVKHTFGYTRDDNNYVHATVAGYLDFSTAPPRIRSLRLVTEKATYGEGTFEAAVSSMP